MSRDKYDRLQSKQSLKTKSDDCLYHRVEENDPNQHLHMLFIVAEGRCQVTDVDRHNVVIDKPDLSVEWASRS